MMRRMVSILLVVVVWFEIGIGSGFVLGVVRVVSYCGGVVCRLGQFLFDDGRSCGN